MSNENKDSISIEAILNKLDNLSSKVESSFSNEQEINRIKNIIDELRGSLLSTIDNRADFLMKKQKDACFFCFRSLEEKVESIKESNKTNLKKNLQDIKDEISEIKTLYDEKLNNISETVNRNYSEFQSHLKNTAPMKINWKSSIATSIVGVSVTIIAMIILYVFGQYLGIDLIGLFTQFSR
ncbi:MAG: hypothetical protein ACOCV1_05775 [Bacillota bacterium]